MTQAPIKPWLHAHRGASADAPENTLASFALGLRQGADGIELDVHASADGVPMVIHDPDLSRTTDRHGMVAELIAEEIGRANAAAHWAGEADGPTHVPRLSAVLELLPLDRGVVIDVKDVLAVVAVIRQIEQRPGAEHTTRLISFLPEAVALAREVAPWLYTGLLLDEGDSFDEGLEAAARAGHRAIVPFEADLGTADEPATFVGSAARRGLEVGTWTVNDRDRAAALRAAGVAFLMSDVPARLL